MKDLIRLETFFVVVWDGVWASRASWLCSGPSNEAPFEVGGAIAPETTSNDLKASVRVAWVLPFATAGLHRLAGCVVHVGARRRCPNLPGDLPGVLASVWRRAGALFTPHEHLRRESLSPSRDHGNLLCSGATPCATPGRRRVQALPQPHQFFLRSCRKSV